jgi:cytoskeletal protein CcmA (bactofilin family)
MQPFSRLAPPQSHRSSANESAGPTCRPRTVQPHVHANAIRRYSLPRSFDQRLGKFLNKLLIDGEVEGTIDSTGTLTIGEHASIRGEIRTQSVKVRGTVEGNIFVTERCELQAGSTLHGDIEAPRLRVDEKATFLGSAKVGTA